MKERITTESEGQIEDRCRASWDNEPAIQAEFISYENYLAYEKAAAAGQVKILGKPAA